MLWVSGIDESKEHSLKKWITEAIDEIGTKLQEASHRHRPSLQWLRHKEEYGEVMATRRCIWFILTVVWFALLLDVSSFAADSSSLMTDPATTPGALNPSLRVALVIGNAAYSKDPLPFTINDANEMAQTLSSLGFDVTVATNVSLKQMQELTTGFVRKARGSQVALFYFAGHGESHVEGAVGENFLLPVDVIPGQGQENFVASLPVTSALLNPLATSIESRISIIILDACRTKSVTRNQGIDASVPSLYQGGLATMSLPSGTFVAYGAAPGTAAFESSEAKHGRFTQSLLKHIVTQGISIEQVFKRVRSDVEQMTDSRQSPREESSLRGDQNFYFVDPAFAMAGRGLSIRRYAGRQGSAVPSPISTTQRELLDTIRTTPAPSRMRALRELMETRAVRLSVSDAENVLSYFWRTARSKALRTMASQLPATMPLGDVAHLIQKTNFQSSRRDSMPSFEELNSTDKTGGENPFESFEGDKRLTREMYEKYLAKQEQYFDPQYRSNQMHFEHLKSLGKVDPKIQFQQLAQQLHATKMKERCTEERNQDLYRLSSARAVQGPRPSETSANQQLLELVADPKTSFERKRQLLKNLFESHRIELSFDELVNVLAKLPAEARGDVLIRDLNKAVPDYVTWGQLPSLLKLINKSVLGDQTMPRRALISHWVGEGILDANLSQEERIPIDQLLCDEATGMLGRKYGEGLQRMDKAPNNNNVPKEIWERRKDIMQQTLSQAMGTVSSQLVGLASQVLNEVMACNDRSPQKFTTQCRSSLDNFPSDAP